MNCFFPVYPRAFVLPDDRPQVYARAYRLELVFQGGSLKPGVDAGGGRAQEDEGGQGKDQSRVPRPAVKTRKATQFGNLPGNSGTLRHYSGPVLPGGVPGWDRCGAGLHMGTGHPA